MPDRSLVSCLASFTSLLLLMLWLFSPQIAQGADAADKTFLSRLSKSKWRLFGATSIEHLEYFSGKVSQQTADGRTVGEPLDLTVVRPGIARWDIDKTRQNWCFYSTRMEESIGAIVVGGKHLKVKGVPRALPLGDEKAFNSALTGVVWETPNRDAAFQWKDGELAITRAVDGKQETYTCRTVLPGVLHWTGVDGNTFLFVFDADGSQAWFLSVDRLWVAVKNGSLKTAPNVSGTVPGMNAVEMEVVHGFEHCLQSSEQELGLLAYGEVRQRLLKRKAPPEVLNAFHKRVGID